MRRIAQLWQSSHYNLWFLPVIIMIGAVLLAALTLELDTRVDRDTLSRWPWLFGTSAESARSLLEAVAGTMITVTALTFSIAVLVMSSGASYYTPRLIRTFMGSKTTQAVLGAFAGIFVYCLIVMRSIQGDGESATSSVAVTTGIFLSMIGVGFLILFIHHIASSIQASAVVSSVSADTIDAIEALYPESLEGRNTTDALWKLNRVDQLEWFPVYSSRTGYLRAVDCDALFAFAKKHLFIVKMEKAPGEFVTQGLALASITAIPSSAMMRRLNSFYSIGHYRTVQQDVGTGIRQLVDIALKAMSPAMNDTTTAIMCIDFLSSILIKLAPRRIAPDPGFSNGELVLIPKGSDFRDFLRDAFEQIREHAQGNVAIYVRLLEALETVACSTVDRFRKEVIAEQVRLVSDYARCNVQFPDQLKRIEKHRTQALKHCELEIAAP